MQLWNAARTQGLHGCTFFTKSALPLEKVQEVQEKFFNRNIAMTCPWLFCYFPGIFFSAAFATALPKKSAYRYSWFCEKTPARRNNFFKFFHLNFIHSSNIENELLFKIERIVFVRNVATIYLRINWMIWFWILAPNLQMTSTYNNPFIVPIYHFIFFLISAIKVISAGSQGTS